MQCSLTQSLVYEKHLLLLAIRSLVFIWEAKSGLPSTADRVAKLGVKEIKGGKKSFKKEMANGYMKFRTM